jgi:hypothetical protein
MKTFSVYLLCLDSSEKPKKVFTGEVVKQDSSDYFGGSITENGNEENTLKILGRFGPIVTTFSCFSGSQETRFVIGANKENVLGGSAGLGLVGKYGIANTPESEYDKVIAGFEEKEV